MPAKKYIDYMDEISSDELYEGLLSYGIFADKLPPIFTGENFFQYVSTLQQPFSAKAEHGFIFFESMRDINIPRPLGIPNPMAYQLLCKCLANHWPEIKDHFQNQTGNDIHKVSRIHIRKIKDSKALFEMNYQNWKIDESPVPDLLIGNRYRVCADISTCFPSMYSHALCWAIAGIDYAKAHREDTLWFNALDTRCMKTKNGETHGFLIGPHTSNLLSEIILTVVDKELVAEGWRYIRNIDDYTCYVASYEEAQRFLGSLNKHLREFDLPLNHKKTKIEELPVASTTDWVHRLNAVELVAYFGKVSFKTARAYLDTAVKLMYENGKNASVIKYAVKVLSSQKLTLTDNAKKYCSKTIMHLAVIFPYLVPLLEKYVFVPYEVEQDEIKIVSKILYIDGIKGGNYEEAIYAIYFAIKHQFEIEEIATDDAIDCDSCLLKLFVWMYFSNLNDDGAIKKLKQHARDILEKSQTDNDFDKFWLFLYEALPMSKLKGEWKPMKRAGVSFIKDFSKW